MSWPTDQLFNCLGRVDGISEKLSLSPSTRGRRLLAEVLQRSFGRLCDVRDDFFS